MKEEHDPSPTPGWEAKRVFIDVATIVVSILLAFGIDAWWDLRQAEVEATDLVANLRSDFEETQSDLHTVMQEHERGYDRVVELLKLSEDPTAVHVDSLQSLLVAAFSRSFFRPTLASYRGAVASGELSVVASPDFIREAARFEDALETWEQLDALVAQVHYVGAGYQLRREMGSLGVLLGGVADAETPHRLAKTDSELLEVFRAPAMYAYVESRASLMRNILGAFQTMDKATSSLLDELDGAR